LGNQIDCGTAIDFHVSRTASAVTTGGIWWTKPLPNNAPSPPKLKYENYKLLDFVNFYNAKASTGKQKTHSNHNVG